MTHDMLRRPGASVRVAGALLALSVAAPAAAQVPLTPRALGMGGAYVAVARGNETLFLNPANLGLSGTPHWSLSFPQVSVGTTLVGPAFEDLPDIFNYDDTNLERRAEILSMIPEEGTEIRYDFRAPLFALQNGRFAFGVSYGSVGGHSLGRDLVDLVFFGYDESRSDYSVGNTRGTRATFWDFAAGFGHRVGPVSLGVTAHYIRGGTVLNSRLFEPRIDIDARDIEVDYRTVYAKGGQGYGVDFGLAYQPVPSVTLSAAVANAVAKMEWSNDLYTRNLTLSRGEIDNGDPLVLQDRYETSEQKLDASSAPLAVLETAEGLYDEGFFPATARLGAAWQGKWGTTLSASYQSQLTEGRLGDRWETIAGVGLQQKLPLITLRGGYATNLNGGTMLTGGLSLGVLQFGAAKVDEGSIGNATNSGWIGTFGIGVKTQGLLD